MTEFFGSWNGQTGDKDDMEVEEETMETITTTTTSKSSSTKTTTMTTPAKLYGRELASYDEVDVDELLSKLTQEELTMLAKEVDPDDNFLPPSQRNNYECEKDPTGPLNRKKLIEHINKQALETPDRPEVKPFVAGVIRGKKWIPPPPPEKVRDADEQITIDLGDEYEQALSTASQEEIIDLAAILGFHSMMNQDQYHASLLNKGQPVGLGWDGITKATKQKVFPMDPPNDTDPEDTLTRIKQNDQKLTDLNWNNIKNISDEKFEKLFEGLKSNTNLEVLSLVNVGLNDRTAQLLGAALEHNTSLRVVNVETNFISPQGVVALVKSLLVQNAVEEFRASNQRSQVLGNKIEMEITSLVEQNPTLLRLGLHLEYSDARHRVASHLQRNIDRNCRVQKRSSASLTLRLPRGRPPAVGIDSSFFNLTPPSAEAITPITESVEQSITIEAKDPKTGLTPSPSPIPDSVSDISVTPAPSPLPDIETPAPSPLPDIETPAPSPLPDIETPAPSLLPDIETPAPSPLPDISPAPSPLPSELNEKPETPEVTESERVSVDEETTGAKTDDVKNGDAVDRFVHAQRPDFNPNPHSTPATSEPDQRLDP